MHFYVSSEAIHVDIACMDVTKYPIKKLLLKPQDSLEDMKIAVVAKTTILC